MNRLALLAQLSAVPARRISRLSRNPEAANGAGKLVILDRDGVINEDSREFIKTPRNGVHCPAVSRPLPSHGRRFYGRSGHESIRPRARPARRDDARAIHRKMISAVMAAGGRIDAIHYCPHGPGQLRLPQAASGTAARIAARYDLDLRRARDRRFGRDLKRRARSALDRCWC